MQTTAIDVHDLDIGLAEHLRDHTASEWIEVKNNGEVIGYYIPVRPKNTEAARAAIEEFRVLVQQTLAESGMTEDELADALLIGDHRWDPPSSYR